MIEKPEDASMIKENCVAMVQAKVLKQLSILQQHKFDDEDIMADIEFLNEKLLASIQDLSSFDEYSTEVKSGRLEWSPVHKSERFWRENAPRLIEKNYELLKMLVHLLETSRDTLVLAVASYDIGEFVRHYPRGKRYFNYENHSGLKDFYSSAMILFFCAHRSIIEQLGGKQMVMQLLAHEDPNVRYEALLAVQKLMVHNWYVVPRMCFRSTRLNLPFHYRWYFVTGNTWASSWKRKRIHHLKVHPPSSKLKDKEIE